MTGIHVDEFLPHPPEKVWHALTDPALMARWLMPNDFRLELGHRFTFHADPIPAAGFGGTGHDGFDLSDPYQEASRRILGAGWPAMPGNISAVLDEEG